MQMLIWYGNYGDYFSFLYIPYMYISSVFINIEELTNKEFSLAMSSLCEFK